MTTMTTRTNPGSRAARALAVAALTTLATLHAPSIATGYEMVHALGSDRAPAQTVAADAGFWPAATAQASSPGVSAAPATYADLPGLPRAVDLSRWDMPPGDQGFVGSCAAWATTYSLVGWWANRQHLPGAPFAPMASYHAATDGTDIGSFVVANMVADMHGLVPQIYYTQGNYNYRSGLTAPERRIAGHFRVADWYAVYSPPTFDPHSGSYIPQADARHFIEASIARGVPVVVTLTVFGAMEVIDARHYYIGASVDRSGVAGPHAVFASHYDAHGLWIENSWGLNWGRGGYAELSWDFVNRYVDGAMAISGLRVDGDAPVAAPSAGPAHLAVSGVLREGHEVVFTGTGFRPGALVSLYRDGAYIGRWPVTPWGTFQVEAYFHPKALEGPHNHHWTAGAHTLMARDGNGNQAQVTLTVAGNGSGR